VANIVAKNKMKKIRCHSCEWLSLLSRWSALNEKLAISGSFQTLKKVKNV